MSYCIVGAYFAILSLLMVYCVHRCWILCAYIRYRHARPMIVQLSAALPRVTVQLPIYNERYVVGRLLHAVAALEYPRELLEIQVLDDSTDETPRRVRRLVQLFARQGLNIRYRHRERRRGFKAGALQRGLKQASGELIAVFDADFVPYPDFLRRIVPFFHDRRVGMVQSRWGHINRGYSLLTRLQAMFLDGHFILEHTARNRSGKFFNFNGTAGVWRKACIADAGGWHGETLTEDLDLSYRAQLRGWRFVFVPDVVAPAEIPVDMPSFKSQQHRWAKGGIQTARKLLAAGYAVHSSVYASIPFLLLFSAGYLYAACLSLYHRSLPMPAGGAHTRS